MRSCLGWTSAGHSARPTPSIPDWEVGAVSAVTFDFEAPALGDTFSVFRVSIPVERRSSYYLYRLILPHDHDRHDVFGDLLGALEPGPTCQHRRDLCADAVRLSIRGRCGDAARQLPDDDGSHHARTSIVVFLVLLEAFTVAHLVGKARDAIAEKMDISARIALPVGHLVRLAALSA